MEGCSGRHVVQPSCCRQHFIRELQLVLVPHHMHIHVATRVGCTGFADAAHAVGRLCPCTWPIVGCSQVCAGRTVGSQAEQAWSSLGLISHRTRYQGIPNRCNTVDDAIAHYADRKIMGLPDQLKIMHATARRRVREQEFQQILCAILLCKSTRACRRAQRPFMRAGACSKVCEGLVSEAAAIGVAKDAFMAEVLKASVPAEAGTPVANDLLKVSLPVVTYRLPCVRAVRPCSAAQVEYVRNYAKLNFRDELQQQASSLMAALPRWQSQALHRGYSAKELERLAKRQERILSILDMPLGSMQPGSAEFQDAEQLLRKENILQARVRRRCRVTTPLQHQPARAPCQP